MKLNQYTDYSLRVLIFLASTKKKDELATIREISDLYKISKNHLVKVVHRLSQLGYLETSIGKYGGIKLGINPESINLAKVIRDMESSMSIVECLHEKDGAKHCIISGSCILAGVLEKSLNAFMEELAKYTLYDLVKNERALTQKYHISR